MSDKTDPETARDDELMRRYVLGALSGAALDDVEARLIADERFGESIAAIEAELADEFVAGDLPPSDHALFAARLRVSPLLRSRVGFAERLARVRPRTTAPPLPAPRRNGRVTLWLSLAAAAALLIVVGGLWFSPDTSPPPAMAGGTTPPVAPNPTPTPDVPAPPAATIPTAPVIATIALFGVAVRDPSNPPSFRVPGGRGDVRIEMGIDDADVYPTYDVAIETSGGQLVRQARGQAATRGQAGRVVTWLVQAAHLPSGRYAARVSGRRGNTTQLLSEYPFSVTR